MKQIDPDIVRAARNLIEFYGTKAEAVAEERASHVAPFGESNGAAVTWHRISAAVRTLQQKQSQLRPGPLPRS